MLHGSNTITRSHFPKRPQTIGGTPIEIFDGSDFYEERAAYSSPDIDTIDARGLFAQDEVVIGIGRPNVFTLIPDGVGNHLRFAAKSFKRAPSKIEETKDRVQSSIFFILKHLSDEQILGIMQSAEKHEGSRNWTCVNENMRLLSDAGITLGNGESLNGIYWPAEAFKKISENGIKVDGKEIDIDILKTSRRYLENQVFETRKSVAMTPFRHGKRWLVDRGFIKKENQGIRERKIDYPIAPKMEHKEHHQTDITLIAANTPKISSLFRSIWGAHGILGIEQDRVDVNTYLQEELQAYPQKNPSLVTCL